MGASGLLGLVRQMGRESPRANLSPKWFVFSLSPVMKPLPCDPPPTPTLTRCVLSPAHSLQSREFTSGGLSGAHPLVPLKKPHGPEGITWQRSTLLSLCSIKSLHSLYIYSKVCAPPPRKKIKCDCKAQRKISLALGVFASAFYIHTV